MSGKATTFTNPIPCSHLAGYRRRHGVMGYRSLQSSLRTSPSGKAGVLRDDVSQMPRCSSCSAGRGRLYFCLVCSKVFCFAAAVSHCQSEKEHEIAVDVGRAELFCCACRDQVYDPTSNGRHAQAGEPAAQERGGGVPEGEVEGEEEVGVGT